MGCMVLSSTAATQRFVASYGEDSHDCLTMITSCFTLGRAIHVSSDDDVIYIDSQNDTDNNATGWLCKEDPIHITKSVSIIGTGLTIGCGSSNMRRLWLVIRGNDVIQVTLRHLTLSGVLLDVTNAKLVVHDVTLRHVNWTSNFASHISLHLSDSTLIGRGRGDNFVVTSSHVDFMARNFTVAHAKLVINAGSSDFSMQESLITNLDEEPRSSGGLVISLKNKSRHSNVFIGDSRFQRQYSNDPVIGIQNLNDAALRVQSEVGLNLNPNVSLSVERCVFEDNERGMVIFGPFEHIRVFACEFVDNIAMHAGAGILLLTRQEAAVAQVVNCTFRRNAAGAYRDEIVRDHAQTFVDNEHEVVINSKCCKGVISLVGKGGALRVQRGNVSLIDCIFVQNTARLLGGAIFVDRDGNLTVERFYAENSDRAKRHLLEGEFIYSNGVVNLKSAHFNARSAVNHVSILCHSGAIWSMEVIDIMLDCPVGYRLRVTNTSAYRISQKGMMKSYKLDQLAYFCESCQSNTYSLDHGYLYQNLSFMDESYFTLMINGENPESAYQGLYVHHDIVCQVCPYGGKCVHSLTAVPNFWGYKTNSSGVRFQRCQKGYCCSDPERCKGFDTCKTNRVGTLCGVCAPGYSEAMFTADCVHNSLCDESLGWPVMITSGILYFVFLLFQKDMRDLMFSQMVRISSVRPPAVQQQASNAKASTSANMDLELHLVTSEPNEKELLSNDKSTPVAGVENTQPIFDGRVEDISEKDEMMRSRSDDIGSTAGTNGSATTTEYTLLHSQPTQPPPPPAPVPSTPPAPTDMGVSFLIIIFFYFQDAQLLHIKTAFTSAENQSKTFFRELLSGLFQFRVELFQFMDKFCFLENMTALKKILVRVGMVPCVLLQFGIVCFVYRCCCKRRKGTAGSDNKTAPPGPSVSVKLATGFTLALLFTYQQLATSSFVLLNCVSVEHRLVLFVQGTIDCYQPWQYGVIAYAASCIVPFCLVLLIGPGMLRDDLIRLGEFFVACIVPLPFLLRWCWVRLRLYCSSRPVVEEEAKPLRAETKAVLQILQGPFKEQRTRYFGHICGQGFLIGRRLILVLLYTFVNDTLLRMLCIMSLCFLILLHHVHALPYKDLRGNMAGSVSAACLLVLGTINLLRASFESAEYLPQGPNEQLMWVLEEVENCLTLWLPGVVMGFVIATLTVKLVALCFQKGISVAGRVPRSEAERGQRGGENREKGEGELGGCKNTANDEMPNYEPLPVDGLNTIYFDF